MCFYLFVYPHWRSTVTKQLQSPLEDEMASASKHSRCTPHVLARSLQDVTCDFRGMAIKLDDEDAMCVSGIALATQHCLLDQCLLLLDCLLVTVVFSFLSLIEGS